jgi:hypothetical protein
MNRSGKQTKEAMTLQQRDPAARSADAPPADSAAAVVQIEAGGTGSGATAAAAADSGAAPPAAATTPVRDWIHQHDYKWLFVIVYLGLAVVLSVFVSLFWLVFMAGVHLLLEYIRHLRPGWGATRVLAHAAWEVKLDFALVLLALGAVLYIDVVMGVLGIQSAARAAAVSRAGARAAARIAAWERNVRAFLLTIDEMLRIGRAATLLWRRRGRKGVVAAVTEREDPATPPWKRRWALGDRVSIAISAACLLLIAAAPLVTQYGWAEVAEVLAAELRPIPGR